MLLSSIKNNIAIAFQFLGAQKVKQIYIFQICLQIHKNSFSDLKRVLCYSLTITS